MNICKEIGISFLAGFVILCGCSQPESLDLPGEDPFAGLPVLETEVLLDINDENSGGDGQFYFQGAYFRDMVISEDGNFFVSNMRGTDIQQFDSDGMFVANIGREGRGPGEFMTAPFFDIQYQDTLITLDQNSWIVNMFVNTDGEWRHANSFDLEPHERLRPGAILQLGGNQLGLVYVPNIRTLVRSDDINQLKKIVSSVSYDGTVTSDSLLVVPINQQTTYLGRGGSGAIHDIPYGFKSIINVGPKNSLYHIKTNNFLINIYDNTGQPEDAIKHPNFSIKIEEDDKHTIVEENIGVLMASRREDKQMRDQMYEDLPDFVSPLENMLVDRDSGHIIVKRSEKYDGPSWLLLDPSGSRSGVFDLDDAFDVFDFRNGKIIGAIRGDGDDDLPSVRVVSLQMEGM